MPKPEVGLWDILNQDYLARLAARAPAEPSKDPWAWLAKEILRLPEAEQEKWFLERVKQMLSTGSADERHQLVDTIAHYLGADFESLFTYLKAKGALWRGLPRDA